jgi:hypothetical protein
MASSKEEAALAAIAATLSGVSPHVTKGYHTTLMGRKIEIDVLTRFGDYLFVFECNSRFRSRVSNAERPMPTSMRDIALAENRSGS